MGSSEPHTAHDTTRTWQSPSKQQTMTLHPSKHNGTLYSLPSQCLVFGGSSKFTDVDSPTFWTFGEHPERTPNPEGFQER